MMKLKPLVLVLALLAVACTKPKEKAAINLNLGYEVNGKSLVTDTLCYENEAGNQFLFTEIQWFLSNIELKSEAGDWIMLHQQGLADTLDISRVYYIDTDIPESQTLHFSPVKPDHYTAIRFIFGLDESDNRTSLFTDPPESEMFWPDLLGGGYHYMKLNGKFLDAEGRLAPLAIHLGIGQNEDHSHFYQNYFTVELPIDFTITETSENQLDLTMNIDNWFRNPNLYDFNEYGSHIMQNQAAQQALKENGNDVFRIGKLTDNENNTNMEKDNRFAEKFKNVMQKAAPKPHFWTWKSVKERMMSPVGTMDNRQAV